MSSRLKIFTGLIICLPFFALSSPRSCFEVFNVKHSSLGSLKARIRETIVTREESVRNRSQLNEDDLNRMSVVPLLESTLSQLSGIQSIIKVQTENLTGAQNSKLHDQQILEKSRARLSQLQNRLANVKNRVSWFENLFSSKGKRLAEKIQNKIDSKNTDVLFFSDRLSRKSSYAERLQARLDEMSKSQDELIQNYILLKEFSQNPNSQNLQQLPEPMREQILGINRNILLALRDLEKSEPEAAAEALKKIVADWLIENDVIYQTYQKIVGKIEIAQDQARFLRQKQDELNTLTNSANYDMKSRRDTSGVGLFMQKVFSSSYEADYQRKLSLIQNQRNQVQSSKSSLSRILNELKMLLNTDFQTSPQNILGMGPNTLTELNQNYRAVELLNIELEKLQYYTAFTEGKLDYLYKHISEQQKKIVDDLLKSILP